MSIPTKWAQFKDNTLNRHLEELYAYINQYAGTSINDSDPYYYVVTYDSSSRLSTETYYLDSARTVPLMGYTYTYTSAGLADKCVQTIYASGNPVSTMNITFNYTSASMLNYEQKQVA